MMQLSGRAGTPPWKMDDVLGCRAVPLDYPKKFCNAVELVWGPIRAEVARLCQAPTAAASVLLRVDVCKKTLEVEQVEHLIPEQVRRGADQRTRLTVCADDLQTAAGWIRFKSLKEDVVRGTLR